MRLSCACVTYSHSLTHTVHTHTHTHVAQISAALLIESGIGGDSSAKWEGEDAFIAIKERYAGCLISPFYRGGG